MSELARDLKRSIDALTSSINKETEARDELLQQWAEETCPHKIGDVVPGCGYSFRDRKVKIDKIVANISYADRYEWAVAGVVLKGDGAPSQNRTRWSQTQEQDREEFRRRVKEPRPAAKGE